jgi:hypothetical protein
MITTALVTSLRTTPTHYNPSKGPDKTLSKKMFGKSYPRFKKFLSPQLRDPEQCSQLLYNEPIICLEQCNHGWLHVKLPEQYSYNVLKKQFEHIQGYIHKNDVCILDKPYITNCVIDKPSAVINFKDGTQRIIPMGTKLRCIKKNKTHILITLPDGCLGIMKLTDIYHMTRHIRETEKSLRSAIIMNAHKLLGSTYCWGGRSPELFTSEHCAASCDCSGLINLSYRATGLELPRNAHPMWLRSKKIKKGKELKAGDLIFLAHPKQPQQVCHVLMYIGHEMIIESCISKGISLMETHIRFKKPIASIKYGDIIKMPGSKPTKYVIYFGSYLSNATRVQCMRDYALGNYDITRWVYDD